METEKSTSLETITCSRCGGSGQFSYCQRWGTTCFKCVGRKRVYTKRGAAARRYMENLLSVPASQLQPGMKVRALVISKGGEVIGDKWSLVEAIEDNAITKRGGSVRSDNSVDYSGINIVTTACTFVGIAPE